MSLPIAAPTHLAPAEYLAWERKADFKNEYLNGAITPMSGASEAHNLITANTSNGLYNQLIEQGCRVYIGDMRVGISLPAGSYLYPDIAVVCGKPCFEDEVFDTLLNPCIVVEVLSPSTEARDRGEKFAQYRQIASLQEYILVSQETIHVEHYLRQGPQWFLTEYRDVDAVLPLASVDCQLPLKHIYRLVEFPESPC